MSTPDLSFAISTTDVLSSGPVQASVPLALSPENPSFDINDPNLWDLLSDGPPSTAGIRVNETKALMHPAVWQALTMISGDVASLPLELFREEPDGDRIIQDNDPLHELVRWQPNPEMNAFRFWKRMLSWLLLWGNAYAYIVRRGDGSVAELLPLLPDRTAPERVGGRLIYVTEVGGELVPIQSRNVLHLEGLSIDTLAGYSFIKAARQAIGLALAEIDFASKFFRNGGRVGGILELSSATPKPARDKIVEGFQRHYSSNEAFKTVILRDNAKFHQAQVSPEAAQVVDARQESVRDIARYFNIRPGKLGEESKTSFASKAEDNRDHYDTTLRPHLLGITQECRSKLLTPEQKRQGYYFRHDTKELLSMDFAKLSEALSKLRVAEIINANEARKSLNMNRRTDADGDKYVNPNVNVQGKPQSDSGADTEAAAQAFRSLASSTVQRMARFVATRAKKLAGNPSDFIQWIDDGYEGQRESVTEAVGEIIQAASDVIEIDAEATTTAIVSEFMDDSRKLLQQIADTTAGDELRSVVDASMTEWAASAGSRYTSQLFTEDQ